MKRLSTLPVILLVFLICAALPLAAQAQALSEYERCLLQQMRNAGEELTIGQARAQCRKQQAVVEQAKQDKAPEPGQLIAERKEIDQSNILKPFTLMAHKPNYFLFYAYNFVGYDSTPYQQQYRDDSIEADNDEVQFQISIKTPLAINLFNYNFSLWGAYTNRSFWQFYNGAISSPFRETNHEPEIWAQWDTDYDILGFENGAARFGIVHQSNGQGGVLSRSWNRIFAEFILERGNAVVSFKPWFRIPESAADDDNPEITDYLGNYELRLSYKLDDHVFSLMSRNNLQSGFQRGAIEGAWSFPIFDYPYLKGYVQYFGGYGESLIDYDHYVNRVGVGIILVDWL